MSTSDAGGEDIVAHFSEFRAMASRRSPPKNQKVTYETKRGRKCMQAA
jgi:cold shock CspA family protein